MTVKKPSLPPISFSLDWLELEILKLLKKSNEPIYKGEIITVLRDIYGDDLAEKPESTFYAIFDKLQENGFAKFQRIPGKGYKTFAKITEKGTHELNNAINWAVSTLLTEFTTEIVNKLQPLCKKHMACQKNLTFGIIGLNTPDMKLPEICNRCVGLEANEKTHNRINMILPELPSVISPSYQNIQVTTNNLLLRDNSMNRILSILSLGSITEKQRVPFVHEIKRILAPQGIAAFYELKEFHSYFYEAMQNITKGFNLLKPVGPLSYFYQFQLDELKTILSSAFREDEIQVIDLHELVLLRVQKI